MAGSDLLDFAVTLPLEGAKDGAGRHSARLVAEATAARASSQLRALPRAAHEGGMEAPRGIEPRYTDLQSVA